MGFSGQGKRGTSGWRTTNNEDQVSLCREPGKARLWPWLGDQRQLYVITEGGRGWLDWGGGGRVKKIERTEKEAEGWAPWNRGRERRREGSRGTWMNSCIRAIYSTTGKFPGDKSSGNDKLHCTANSTYLSSNSSLQAMCLTSTGLNEKESWGQSLCVCVLACLSWQRSRSCHPVLLPGKETDGRPKTLKNPPNTGALMRPWKTAALVFGCFPLPSSWPSGKMG